MEPKEIVDILKCENGIPKYLFGTNEFSKIAKDYLETDGVIITGFINEYTDSSEYLSLPVYKSLDKLEPNAVVLNCVVLGRPITAKTKLDNRSIANVDFFSFIKYSGYPICIPYWRLFHKYYKENKSRYDGIYNLLSDEESKDVFRRLIDFRLNYNLEAMSVFTRKEKEQYFEPFLNLKQNGESFVDVGGFDGDTSIEFIKRCPRYDKIYFFEPEPDLMARAKSNLKDYNNIDYCQVAASDKKGTLYFSSNSSASKICDNGTIEIQADTIDSIINSKVTFIKMDIEGSESIAIKGAEQTILNYHPRLAICVYHKGNDYIDIPRQVLAIRDDYNLYMRHYSEGVTETVMFFMPKK